MKKQIRHTTISYSEFLELMKNVPVEKKQQLEHERISKVRDRVYANIDGVETNLTSQRLVLFERNNTCVCCGCKGTYLAIEKNEKDKGNTQNHYHLNLYGTKDGKEVLFTKDHIKAKSKGGKDILSNYQTMCVECNAMKGNKEC